MNKSQIIVGTPVYWENIKDPKNIFRYSKQHPLVSLSALEGLRGVVSIVDDSFYSINWSNGSTLSFQWSEKVPEIKIDWAKIREEKLNRLL